MSVHRMIHFVTQLPSFYTFYKPDDEPITSKQVGIFKNKSYSFYTVHSPTIALFIKLGKV
jgi:hypothetical protein